MAVGRISGPLLKSNLLRDGVDLAFETNLLYLDVTNGRVGVNTATPGYDLEVNGTVRSTNAIVDTQTTIASFTVSGNTIASSNSTINLEPSGANAVVYQGKLQVNSNLQLTTNAISTTVTDANLEFNTIGVGQVRINSNTLINGNLHVTGNLQVDGDSAGQITIGDSNTDAVDFKADVASNIIPDNQSPLYTPVYDLGSTSKRWANVYTTDIQSTSITSAGITINGINLELPQGNIYYVATTGSNSNAGEHENNPVLTLKYALSLAGAGDTVYIYPGVYTEIFPLTIPVGVAVKGAGIRAVTIQPTVGTVDKDAFLLNGETTVEDLTVTGFRYNGTNNTGYGFRFATGFTVTTRSPYIKNVTVLTRGSVVNAGDPYGFDQNDAGKGVLADGSVANALSKEASMLFHSVTFFTPNQETITATNGVRIEWLNSFSYFADKGFYAYSSPTGFAGAGLTRLRIDTKTGTWNVGNTVTYYDTNGSTVLGTGTIASVSGNYVNLTGRQLGFETITDRAPGLVYAQGDAKLSTSQFKFGTASLALDGVGDYVSHPTTPDFTFGTGNWTVELWAYRTVTGVIQTLFDYRTASGAYFQINLGSTGVTRFAVSGVTQISGPNLVLSTWTHIAVSKASNVTRMFVNGTVVGTTYTDTNNYGQAAVYIGATSAGTGNFSGYIDDVRVSNGVARYTTTFTAPTAALKGDIDTVLLLHFNGANNSTIFVDDGITYQDIRTSAGGTATIINFADYSDFGAEIRSIGSASIYGNYGVYGDGIGVIGYFVSHNVAYVGAGKLVTNDPNDRVGANEFIQLNGAKIYHTSVDNEGNFTVGSGFSVNQKTGEVVFNGQLLTITSATGVTFTDGIYTTTITPSDITTGNIRIHDNNIDSLTGNINVTAASGAINLQNNTFITGNLDVTGDVNIGGNIQIGDQTTDTVSFVAGINSNLVPATTALYDLGTASLRWNNAYLSRLEVDGLVVDNNTISTTVGNDDLTLSANGTGKILIPSNNVQFDQNLTVGNNLTVTTGTTYLKNTTVVGTITQTGNIVQTGNITTSGDLDVTGHITSTGYLQLPQVRIENNVVSTTGTDLQLQANGVGNVIIENIKVSDNNIQSISTNSDIILTPQGTGNVIINNTQSLQIPAGNGTTDRPGTPHSGMLRFNTDLNRYEGYNGSYWQTLSGVEDTDGNTKIIAEATPGANDNTLYFYADGNLTVTIDSTKLFAQRLQTSNMDLNSNTISSITTDSDLNLTATGTGGVRVGNLRIYNNTITNIATDAVTQFTNSGTGYVKFSGTNGVVIPSGDGALDRPLTTEVGMTRFNTDGNLVEVFNGVTWTSVAGAFGGVTTAEATGIGIAAALIFG
jgi:hypothetical protein